MKELINETLFPSEILFLILFNIIIRANNIVKYSF